MGISHASEVPSWLTFDCLVCHVLLRGLKFLVPTARGICSFCIDEKFLSFPVGKKYPLLSVVFLLNLVGYTVRELNWYMFCRVFALGNR